MNVLALDLANNTGWALYADRKTTYGSLVLGEFKHDRGVMGQRYLKFLRDTTASADLDYIAFEMPFGYSPNVDHIRGLSMITETYAVGAGLQRRIYSASEWRARLLGKAPRKSLEAKKAVKAWCEDAGFAPANYDEADALGILSVALIDIQLEREVG